VRWERHLIWNLEKTCCNGSSKYAEFIKVLSLKEYKIINGNLPEVVRGQGGAI
jgi:hypothetical protein